MTAHPARIIPDPGLGAAPAPAAVARVRDVRLDFFRGAGMFIIFISHVTDNPWAQFIPARFGFSDATETFVFCSGMASALAFARVFDTHGALIGTARIAFRCWQVYWAHVASLLAVIGILVGCDMLAHTNGAFLHETELDAFFGPPTGARLLGLMTLTYVPPYFDILPMYLVILTMIPFVIGLSRIDPRLALAASAALWGIAGTGALELPRDPILPGVWYFNPFAWQLVFFAGFAIMRGWVPVPPVTRPLVYVAIAVVVGAFPLAWRPLLEISPALTAAHDWLHPILNKSHEGALRFVHFLAAAYLAAAAAGENGRRLRGRVVDLFRRVGQQSLASFLSGLALSFLATVVLMLTGTGNPLVVAAVNLVGLAMIVAAALLVGWMKAMPWKRPPVSAIPGRAVV